MHPFHYAQSFLPFRLCDRHWKIDTFASRHYLQWISRPKEDSRVKVKREKVDTVNVKVEQVTQDSTSAAVPSTFKRPQSIAISPLVRISKKKKEVHCTPSPPVFSSVPSAAHHHTCLVAKTTQIDDMPDKPAFEHISNEPFGAARDDPVAFGPTALDKPINLTTSDANAQLSEPAIVGPPRLEVQESPLLLYDSDLTSVTITVRLRIHSRVFFQNDQTAIPQISSPYLGLPALLWRI